MQQYYTKYLAKENAHKCLDISCRVLLVSFKFDLIFEATSVLSAMASVESIKKESTKCGTG